MGAEEGGSGERSGAWKRQKLPDRQEDPLPDCRARALGQAGGAAAACVGGRASRRRAAAGWTWKPRCCPLAPMPATPRMARITLPRPVSSAGGESSLLCAGGGKWEGFTSEPKCSGNFITVLGDCSLLCLEGKGRRGRGRQGQKGQEQRRGQRYLQKWQGMVDHWRGRQGKTHP